MAEPSPVSVEHSHARDHVDALLGQALATHVERRKRSFAGGLDGHRADDQISNAYLDLLHGLHLELKMARIDAMTGNPHLGAILDRFERLLEEK